MKLKTRLHYFYDAARFYFYDARLFICQSLMDGYNRSQDRLIASITLRAHVVEKGLTMPNMRPLFGQENLLQLLSLCHEYVQLNYDTNHIMFQAAIGVAQEYSQVHQSLNVDLPDNIQIQIQSLSQWANQEYKWQQPCIKKADMYKHTDFLYAAMNRHSVRQFSGAVNKDDLYKAIQLATTAPSACNRQPIRVHIINKGSVFDQILSVQMGNRGFGNLADKLLVITADTNSYNGLQERNCMWVDGGIFTMNLLYALQYYSIAACTLNCCFLPKQEEAIKKLLNTQERPVTIIAIGDCDPEVKVAQSVRMPFQMLIKEH